MWWSVAVSLFVFGLEEGPIHSVLVCPNPPCGACEQINGEDI